jgi:hypothetical protein
MVIHNEQTKVAQYGQWDGYPDGQGKTALSFLLHMERGKFIEQLGKAKWANEDEVNTYLLSIGAKDGWLNGDQSKLYHAKYPFFSRDHGAAILAKIYMWEDSEILLEDTSAFAGNSLMCEWAYVIDLDKNTFEIYEGFNKSPLNQNERFFNSPIKDGYYPVKMVKSYSINELPSIEQFLKDLEPVEETE